MPDELDPAEPELDDPQPEDDGLLDASDTLEGDPGDDPLDDGYTPETRWSGR